MTLQRGSKGPEVIQLQQRLNASASGAKLVVDGVFGQGTEAAVKRYQSIHGLTPNGIADAATQKKLGMTTSPSVTSSSSPSVFSSLIKKKISPAVGFGIIGGIALAAILYRKYKS